MTLLIGLPLLAIAAVIQSSVIANFHFYGGSLDLVLIMTLSWTLAGDWEGGAAWGFCGGLFVDLLSGGPFGLTSLALVILAYLASLTEGRLWRSHVLLPLITVAFSTLGLHVISLLGLSVAGWPIDWPLSLLRVTLPAAVLNTVFMLPFSGGLRWLHDILYPAQVKM
jgi:rod shape-determining protein MreD